MSNHADICCRSCRVPWYAAALSWKSGQPAEATTSAKVSTALCWISVWYNEGRHLCVLYLRMDGELRRLTIARQPECRCNYAPHRVGCRW